MCLRYTNVRAYWPPVWNTRLSSIMNVPQKYAEDIMDTRYKFIVGQFHLIFYVLYKIPIDFQPHTNNTQQPK